MRRFFLALALGALTPPATSAHAVRFPHDGEPALPAARRHWWWWVVPAAAAADFLLVLL